jgi:hypothetical protein
MKRLILTPALLSLVFLYLAGQVPKEFSLQSTIRDSEGKIIQNQTVTIKVTIREAGTNGVVAYSELHQPLTDGNGMVSLIIGQGNTLTGDFSSLDPAKCYIIKTTCNTPQGTACVLYGTSQVLSYRYGSAASDNNSQEADLSLVDNIYKTPGMMILAPPDRFEDWMFETSKIDPSRKP